MLTQKYTEPLCIGWLQNYRLVSWLFLVFVRATDKPLLFDLGAATAPASRVVGKNCIFKAFHLFLWKHRYFWTEALASPRRNFKLLWKLCGNTLIFSSSSQERMGQLEPSAVASGTLFPHTCKTACARIVVRETEFFFIGFICPLFIMLCGSKDAVFLKLKPASCYEFQALSW